MLVKNEKTKTNRIRKPYEKEKEKGFKGVKIMKKFIALIAGLLAAVSVFTFAGCAGGGEKNILVVTREAGSGTREAFDNYAKITADNLIKDNATLSSTGNVREKVATNKTAIGYISLASVNDTVKALKVEGVEPTHENVRSGDYKIQRPFLLLTKKDATLNAAAQDFFNYCMSLTAKSGIESMGGITTNDFSSRKTYEKPTAALSGKVVIKGSTSMEEMIKKLLADYKTLNGDLVKDVDFSLDFPGSSGGRTAAKEDTNGQVIGLASSSKPDAAYVETTLCLDAVAIIVNKNNDAIDNINAKALNDIYTGKVLKFSEVTLG